MRRFQYQIGPNGELLISDAQGYQAQMVIRGDFPSDTHRREYAEELLKALNAAPIPTLEHTRWAPARLTPKRLTERHSCY